MNDRRIFVPQLVSRLVVCALLLLVTVVAGCDVPPSTRSDSVGSVPQAPQSIPGFVFIDSKIDPKEPEAKMELFVYAGEERLTQNRLVEFCKDRKSKADAQFYYAVLFDDAANAKFPSNPFSAGYGMNFEILKHIKGEYHLNKNNGYSKLHYDAGRKSYFIDIE